MKSIRKQLKPISLFMTFLVLFVSCEQYDDGVETPVENKLSGEEIFKSIFFADGVLTEKLPSLSSIDPKGELSESELTKFETYKTEIVDFLKEKNQNYFEDFQKVMYSQNPSLISKAISKSAEDIIPWANEKLALHDLTIEEISKTKDIESIKKNIPNAYSKKACAVLVAALVVAVIAAVAVAVTIAVTISITWGEEKLAEQKSVTGNITLEALSIQIAEELNESAF